MNLIESGLTRCPWHIRAMGYLKDAIRVRKRFQRCRTDWQEHIENCRLIITQAMSQCAQRRKAVILGAGMLHDVPLAELSKVFREVHLVDIVHPFFSRRRTRRFKNVFRITADITGTVRAVYEASDEPDMALPRLQPTLFLEDPEIDLTVSVNLLSQLPCMPMSYLMKQRAHSLIAINNYARHLVQAHVDYLRHMHGMVVLITDVERLKIDLMGRIIERKDLLFEVKLPPSRREWEWRLAPCPEADSRHHYYRRVVAIDQFN